MERWHASLSHKQVVRGFESHSRYFDFGFTILDLCRMGKSRNLKSKIVFASVAQRIRAPDFESGGCRFESCQRFCDLQFAIADFELMSHGSIQNLKSKIANRLTPSSSGQDASLSSLKRGFDSLWGHSNDE